jgi:hypothetical protein
MIWELDGRGKRFRLGPIPTTFVRAETRKMVARPRTKQRQTFLSHLVPFMQIAMRARARDCIGCGRPQMLNLRNRASVTFAAETTLNPLCSSVRLIIVRTESSSSTSSTRCVAEVVVWVTKTHVRGHDSMTRVGWGEVFKKEQSQRLLPGNPAAIERTRINDGARDDEKCSLPEEVAGPSGRAPLGRRR